MSINTTIATLVRILDIYVSGVERLLAGDDTDRAHLESRTRFLRELIDAIRDEGGDQ